jgi:hypothetical protein
MLRELVHYGIHFLLPVLVGVLAFPAHWVRATLILLSGILIDLDHLWATPVFDPMRCSIGFHPLHTYPAIAVYTGLLFFRRSRIWGMAFLIHILADATDCWLLGFGL